MYIISGKRKSKVLLHLVIMGKWKKANSIFYVHFSLQYMLLWPRRGERWIENDERVNTTSKNKIKFISFDKKEYQ